jgi:integrase
MTFMSDKEQLKKGLVIFRRTDVKHNNWYCRVRVDDLKKYKTVSLKTPDVNAARDKALDVYAETRFKVQNDVAVFDQKFSQVAQDFSQYQKERSETGEITHHRWRVMDSHIRTQLNKYVKNVQISKIGEDRWKEYPTWRRRTGKGRSGDQVSNGTIRDEMATFRSVMKYAASKRLIRESQVFKGKLLIAHAKRAHFTKREWDQLHRFTRSWVKNARNSEKSWYREMIYNFILIMKNTGIRTTEARSLRWGDVDLITDTDERQFVVFNVWGKGKKRSLVAGSDVWKYLERIRKIARSTKIKDYIFTTYNGKQSRTLYGRTIRSLLEESGLQYSTSGSRRSTYCFRHTFAVDSLRHGVDVYLLAEQMGTSVKMIEQHYGHVSAIGHRAEILKGRYDWVNAVHH